MLSRYEDEQIKKVFSEAHNHTIVSDKLYNILKNFSFQKIIKCDPDDRQKAFDKWGCPSDAETSHEEFLGEDGTVNLINSFGEFYTEWHPPVEIVRALQKKFSDYTFALDFIDEGFCFCGSVDINGKYGNKFAVLISNTNLSSCLIQVFFIDSSI